MHIYHSFYSTEVVWQSIIVYGIILKVCCVQASGSGPVIKCSVYIFYVVVTASAHVINIINLKLHFVEDLPKKNIPPMI